MFPERGPIIRSRLTPRGESWANQARQSFTNPRTRRRRHFRLPKCGKDPHLEWHTIAVILSLERFCVDNLRCFVVARLLWSDDHARMVARAARSRVRACLRPAHSGHALRAVRRFVRRFRRMPAGSDGRERLAPSPGSRRARSERGPVTSTSPPSCASTSVRCGCTSSRCSVA